MEETTTETPVVEAAEQPQPQATEPVEAVQPEVESTEPVDDNSEWLTAKGIDPTDEQALAKVAKMAREAEKAMHQKAQKASELEKSVEQQSDIVAEQIADQTGQDPELLKRLQRMEVKESVRDFFDTTPKARELELEMVEELKIRPHLAGDLEALYAVVSSRNSDIVRTEAKRETLEQLAQNQRASVPSGAAVNPIASSKKITPQNVDQLVGENNIEWYKSHRDEINAALSQR